MIEIPADMNGLLKSTTRSLVELIVSEATAMSASCQQGGQQHNECREQFRQKSTVRRCDIETAPKRGQSKSFDLQVFESRVWSIDFRRR